MEEEIQMIEKNNTWDLVAISNVTPLIQKQTKKSALQKNL